MFIIGKLEGKGNSLFYISAHLKLFQKKSLKAEGKGSNEFQGYSQVRALLQSLDVRV